MKKFFNLILAAIIFLLPFETASAARTKILFIPHDNCLFPVIKRRK